MEPTDRHTERGYQLHTGIQEKSTSMEDTNRSVLCTQYIPLLCPISKSIPGWHLKSSIKVVYFVTTKTSKSYIELHWIKLQSLPVSLQVSMHSSLSLSALEAVSAALACSVHTVQPLDCHHAHSLLCLRSKVICVLSSIYSLYFCIQSPRVLPELPHESTNDAHHSFHRPL
jgi:hypothetical protein